MSRARELNKATVTSLSLSDDYKTEIHSLLNKVRKVVNAAEITDLMKNAIYDRIAALQAVVDRSNTRFDAFLSRWIDLTNAVGEGVDNLEPLVKLLERVMKVFGRAKSDYDAGRLPPPEENKKLPAPEANEMPQAEPDDEIPF